MSKERQAANHELTVQLVNGDQPGLCIVDERGDHVWIEMSQVQWLAEALSDIATELTGYQVGSNVPTKDESGSKEWRRLIGQEVQLHDGGSGMVMGPVGDWSKSYEYGCMLVCFPDKAPEVHRLGDIKLVVPSTAVEVSI